MSAAAVESNQTSSHRQPDGADHDESNCTHDHTPHNAVEKDDGADGDSDHQVSADPVFTLTIRLHNKPLELPFYHADATLQDLSDLVAEDLHIPAAHQKFLITPKLGLLKPPFADPDMRLRPTLQDKKIVVLGATTAEVAELEQDLAARQQRMAQRRAALAAGRKVKATPHRDARRIQAEAQFTFHAIRPLAYLPAPERSQRYLERLAADPGIKAAMRRHGFAVGLLTEMDPAAHTTHESRTLGLNRNRGEVIELRLRTDAYDGYRDYRVIRKTLCHELTHNVFGPHDEKFWKLCKEIEAEVDRNDWRHGGHSVGGEEFYNPADDGGDVDEEADHGGWEGGEYVLGGDGNSATAGGSADGTLSRREILARAAEERMRRLRDAKAPDERSKDAAQK